MKKIILLTAILSLPMLALSQNCLEQSKVNLNDIQPSVADFENIHVEKLCSDSLSSSFVIWVKKEVKAHKHIKHSEVVLVLEGKGSMKLDGKEIKLSQGDYLFIPRNTVHSVKVETPMKVLSVQAPEFLGEDRVFVE